MMLPDGRPLVVLEGVLREPSDVKGRVVLWLRGRRAGRYQEWERVGNVPHAGVGVERGVRATAAASVPARQWAGGPIGGLLRELLGGRSENRWTLPGGGSAEQCGPRRTDLMLAWSEDEVNPLDEAGVRSRWGEGAGIRRVGEGVYLVYGVALPRPRAESSPESASGETSRSLAERALGEARRAGDERRGTAALADLGAACLNEQDLAEAERSLGKAVEGARRIGDRGLEAGAMLDLGLLALYQGRPDEARARLEATLQSARAIEDRHVEKLALDRLGLAYANLGDHAGAAELVEQAVAIAEKLGDGAHRANLLWSLGIHESKLGRIDRALARAQAAVEQMRRLGLPEAEWYGRHLAVFRAGGSAAVPHQNVAGSGLVPSIEADLPVSSRRAMGPGVFHMALTAAESMAKFVGSGFETTPAATYRGRIEACVSCEHHAGLRCRLCGCFTAAKARVNHERCPIGKW